MIKQLIATSLLTLSVWGYEITSTKVEFKAFKTPLKLGVKGEFDKVKLHSIQADSIKEMLLGTSVVIDTTSVNSHNKGRDAKLVESFFLVQNNKTIQAKIVSVEKKTLTVAITLNNKTLQIPMHYEVDKDEIEAKGVIDLADFGMLPSLGAINKACYDLHQGKTWQDVVIKFELKYQN